jgi:MerR family mercuric resistance operon transcriptional regulator
MNTTISGLARAGDVGVETVRYYQRLGLIETPARSPREGVRRYGEDDVRRLRFIRSAQSAGFSLEEIAALLALDAGEDRAEARRLAQDRITALDAKIAQLTAAREMLRRLADDCGAGGAGPCPILTAFEPG